jgi:hypothetical protein
MRTQDACNKPATRWTKNEGCQVSQNSRSLNLVVYTFYKVLLCSNSNLLYLPIFAIWNFSNSVNFKLSIQTFAVFTLNVSEKLLGSAKRSQLYNLFQHRVFFQTEIISIGFRKFPRLVQNKLGLSCAKLRSS